MDKIINIVKINNFSFDEKGSKTSMNLFIKNIEYYPNKAYKKSILLLIENYKFFYQVY